MSTAQKQTAPVTPVVDIPFSQEAEEAVIGALVTNPASFFTVAAILKAEDFFLLRCQTMWRVLEKLCETSTNVDYMVVVEALKEAGKLAEIGGAAYVTGLINAAPSSAHVEAYAQLVGRYAVRRRLLAAADELKKLATNQELSVEQVIERGDKLLFNASQMAGQEQVKPFRVLVSDYYDKVERLMDDDRAIVGIPTGLTELDKKLEGLQNSDLLLVAARPGAGKSSLLLTMAVNILKADPGKRIAYFSLEMVEEQLVQRVVSLESGLNLQALRSGKLGGAGGWKRFVDTAGRIASFNLFIDDRPGLTPRQIRAACRKLERQHGKLDLIVIDYVQLMSGGSSFKPSDRVSEVTYISKALKEIAKEFDLPVLSAAQLSREVEKRQDKRPQLSDLRESGSLEQDSDVVMFIYRDEMYNPATEFPNQADIIVAKHRNGPTGTVPLYFEKTLTKFMNAAERSVGMSYTPRTPTKPTHAAKTQPRED